jgi:hypothetical protein
MKKMLRVISATLVIALGNNLFDTTFAQESDAASIENFVTKETFLLDRFVNGYKKELIKNMRKKIQENPNEVKKIKAEYKKKFERTKIGLDRLYSGGRLKLSKIHTMPSLSMATPSGYGSNWGDFSLFALGYNKKSIAKRPDGDAGFAFGLGNSRKYIGATLSYANTNLVDTKNVNGEIKNDYSKPSFDEGVLSVKIHRMLTENSSIAIGRSPLWSYGFPKKLGPGIETTYASYSYRFIRGPQDSLFSTTQISFGLGDKGYLSTKNFANRKSGYAPFFGVGTRLSSAFSFIVDYSREEFTVGSSFAPFATKPFITSLGMRNIFKKDNFNRRVQLSLSYSFRF